MTSDRGAATPEHLVGLTARFRTLATHFGLVGATDVEASPGRLLHDIARHLCDEGGTDAVWVALAVITGSFPTSDDVLAASRALSTSEPLLAHRALLESALGSSAGYSRLDVPVEIVENAIVVDVDFCATHLHNTGIQRVVRQTMKRWSRDHDVLLVGWTSTGLAMRTLDAVETRRVTQWETAAEELASGEKAEPTRIIVPVACRVILPEVPQLAYCPPLASLAQFSGNVVGLVGYDAIPVLSADTVPLQETERFGAYLEIVKHSDLVAGISRAATLEFAGFVEALSAQGLAGPRTIRVQLPVDAPDRESASVASTLPRPAVLCVGSQEPRKNQLAVLFAASVLWDEGLDFTLDFIGGGSAWFTRIFDSRVRLLQRKGRPVRVRRGVSDADMLTAYQQATFTVFPSLHEGYGLPVAESLAFGVPVVTTNYGSTAEIAADGGCITVDPRDDSSLIEGMRSLLTDSSLLARLRAEIAQRPARTWDDYAADLWSTLSDSGVAR